MLNRDILLSGRNWVVENAPAVLTGLGAAGVVGTAILTHRAALNSDKALYKAKVKSDNETGALRDLTPGETFKVAWKYYVPPFLTGVATITCIIGANSVSHKRNLALASAYSLTATALKEYQARVVETIGEGKARKISDSVVQQKVLENPADESTIVTTGNGTTRCFEPLSGRYFFSDIESIRQSVNTVNALFLRGIYGQFLSVNDVYRELGLPDTDMGEMLGWSDEDGIVEPTYTSVLDEKSRPCLCVNLPVAPRFLNLG